ncbi:MAG TPA: CHAD domain-containing protein [Gemmataceae bacterium]|nr:CHAD domain-containing protein [Gemmataceae bacterium]
MQSGKWITDLRPDTLLPDAARRALTVRLEVVRDYLPLALHQPDKDPEHVHQLRVATRRAGAALDIFSVCLPTKVYKTARKRLRRLRRAAGEARDWDVFLLTLTARQRGRRPQPGIDFLMGYALAQRVAAQEHLREANARLPSSFDRLLAETVAAVHRPRSDSGPRTLIDLARPLLTRLLKELDQAAARDLENYDNLHQVRIAGKRLRYAMEVFAACFDPPFREELYPAVEEMQEILGRANDSHVAIGRLEALRDQVRAVLPGEWQRFRGGIDGLLRYHRRRLPRERARFLEWWRRWQDAGTEAALANLLKAPALS